MMKYKSLMLVLAVVFACQFGNVFSARQKHHGKVKHTYVERYVRVQVGNRLGWTKVWFRNAPEFVGDPIYPPGGAGMHPPRYQVYPKIFWIPGTAPAVSLPELGQDVTPAPAGTPAAYEESGGGNGGGIPTP